MLEEIKGQVRINTKLIQELHMQKRAVRNVDLPDDIHFPLKTYKQVEELEGRLQDSNDDKEKLVSLCAYTAIDSQAKFFKKFTYITHKIHIMHLKFIFININVFNRNYGMMTVKNWHCCSNLVADYNCTTWPVHGRI